MSTVKTTNVEKVLPNDDELGRRNCRWREFIQKYEKGASKEIENSMDIDTAIDLLDQEMSAESSVSDVVEASSKDQSAEENPEDIRQQLRLAVPSRKRAWEVNGLKEILDDNEYRMLSHEKVENWLRSRMHSITGLYNLHYKKQVTTVTETETCMDADADSLYSVDTAQYIRSNKQISNKVKVTTMIKQYAVTSSIRHDRLNSLGSAHDEHSDVVAKPQRLSLPPLGRFQSKSDSSCDLLKRAPVAIAVAAPPQKNCFDQHRFQQQQPRNSPFPVDSTRRTRKKVFKKTLPRKRLGSDAVRGHSLPAQQLHRDQGDVYEKALEQCARMKKAKGRRTPCRNVPKKHAMRVYSSTSSSDADNGLEDSDNNDVFQGGPSKNKPLGPRKSLFFHTSPDRGPPAETSPALKTSPSEREILEPFQSITLSASKRQRLQPVVPDSTTDSKPRKTVGIQRDGCYHDEGVVIYRPTTIRPHLDANERITLRMEQLKLDGVAKERHLLKFREFHYRIHPNSTVCFYPSDSESDDGTDTLACEARQLGLDTEQSLTENSYDDDDPILTFHPRHTGLLNVVEIPYRRQMS